MIEHLKGREQALAPLGWTGREAEWIALVCLHSGVFTRTQFCCYFNTYRKQAHRFVKALIEQRAAVETDVIAFNGGGKTCRISSKPLYRALGVENIRHRRKAGAPVVMRRLLSLDFILEHPGMNWLPTEGEKVEFIEEIGLPSRLIPRRIYYGAVRAQKRYFALKLPVAGGDEPGSRIYYEEKRGSVASVAGGDHHGPLPVFGFSWNRPLSPGPGHGPGIPRARPGQAPCLWHLSRPLPVAGPARPPATAALFPLFWPAGFPSFTGEGKTHQTIQTRRKHTMAHSTFNRETNWRIITS